MDVHYSFELKKKKNLFRAWLCVVDVLFYYSRYLILLRYLYYFIVLKAKIDSLLQYVCR